MNPVTDVYLGQAEAARREGPGLEFFPDTKDLPPDDYAGPLVTIGRAMHHLDESLPNRQLQRTRTAYLALRAGTDALGKWLRERGVEV